MLINKISIRIKILKIKYKQYTLNFKVVSWSYLYKEHTRIYLFIVSVIRRIVKIKNKKRQANWWQTCDYDDKKSKTFVLYLKKLLYSSLWLGSNYAFTSSVLHAVRARRTTCMHLHGPRYIRTGKKEEKKIEFFLVSFLLFTFVRSALL